MEEAREKYMHFDLPELDHKRPYYTDDVGGKQFAFTCEHDNTHIQIHLFITLLRSAGELWGLEQYWTQVGC